ncbi:recombinase family protein [Rossellomorea vietnamensis]|uniref:Recombinase family protein n=1 Tax=Rossellomorea vietnamensis TaxID=218284 RepID=A0A6I6UT43_9BACI|nr:recombinase family protein [Rossellomorea vietnamensis]QHE62223.1 recombinase family protein [Rossellomorea vietnamensis]QWC21721.1 recombinase family protein [Bacillus haikouensis]
MDNKEFGYVRVSSKEQNEARQLDIMYALGIDERDIHIDKQSGKDFNRPQYQALKMRLRKGDTLYIHSLDRLGRNKEMILNEWKDITQNIKAHIVVNDMPLLDTRIYNDSIGSFVADLVLQILSWVAEEERNKIKTRQAEGIAAAKAQGKHLGRPKTSITLEFEQAYKQWRAGVITAVEAIKITNMSKATFYRKVKEYEAN